MYRESMVRHDSTQVVFRRPPSLELLTRFGFAEDRPIDAPPQYPNLDELVAAEMAVDWPADAPPALGLFDNAGKRLGVDVLAARWRALFTASKGPGCAPMIAETAVSHAHILTTKLRIPRDIPYLSGWMYTASRSAGTFRSSFLLRGHGDDPSGGTTGEEDKPYWRTPSIAEFLAGLAEWLGLEYKPGPSLHEILLDMLVEAMDEHGNDSFGFSIADLLGVIIAILEFMENNPWTKWAFPLAATAIGTVVALVVNALAGWGIGAALATLSEGLALTLGIAIAWAAFFALLTVVIVVVILVVLVSEFISHYGEVILDYVSQFFDAIQDGIQAMMDAMSMAMEAFAGALEAALDSVMGAIETFIATVVSALGALAEAVGGIVGDILGAIGDAIDGFFDWIASLFDGMVQDPEAKLTRELARRGYFRVVAYSTGAG